MTATKAKPKRTEAEMIRLLRARHGEEGGNGAAYAFVTHVRSAAGFDSRRTLDAIAMGLWPSRGMFLYGFEIKCSRSDWLRELKKPEKMEEFYGLIDFFSIVAADADIVKPEELPPNWGLIVCRSDDRLATKVEPKILHEYEKERSRPLPPRFGRSFLVALLREAVRVGTATPEEILEAEKRGRDEYERIYRVARETWQPMYQALQSKVAEYENELGVPLDGKYWNGHSPADVGRAVRMVLNGEAELSGLKNRLLQVASNAEHVAKAARERAEAIGE